MSGKRQTLGDNVTPLNYNLAFDIDFKNLKYRCTEAIEVRIGKSTRSVRLNAVGLKIKSAVIVCKKKEQKTRARLEKKTEQLVLNFKDAVSGTAELGIEFEGTNGEKLNGFYKSTYKVGKKERHILTTQFEPADARKAFPCFDEPELKATFEVSFLVDKALGVISNMPEKSTRRMGSRKLVAFRKTPRMSSYLLYFGMGEFERLRGKYRNIALSVVTVPGKIRLGENALDYGRKFLKYYEDYFGVRFPLPKMDLIAIPDFAISGMENWGAITYSEIALLTDKKATSVAAKQRIAEVVAHELAHQWFGDLVTMKWWNNLWLNESFATFMSYKALDAVFPEWDMGLQAMLMRTAGALGADQLRSTQKIGVEVNSPGDMSEAFDPDITYSKGAAVLTMLEDYVGVETFRRGLKSYIKRHSYANATEHDLWQSIGSVQGKKKGASGLDRVASYWINTPGYPIVEVGDDGERMRLRQRRFLLLDREDPGVWPIPIHFSGKSEKGSEKGLVLLKKREMEIKGGGFDYVKLNYMQKGFYRVRYTDQMLAGLGRGIKSKGVSALNGWGVESDLFSVARSCSIKVERYLDFVENYCFGSEFPLNSSVSSHLNGLYRLLKDNERLAERIKEINLGYHREILGRLGWSKREGESNTDTLLRSAAIVSLGYLGDERVIGEARRLFKDYLDSGKGVDPDIRMAVYAINAREGDRTAFDRFVSLYKKEQIPEETIRLLRAIGSVKDPELIDMALKFTLSKEVRRQYMDWIPSLVASEDYGKKIIWGWIRGNWKKFMSMYDRGPGGLDDFVEILAVVDNRGTRDEIERFFKNKSNYRDDIKRSIAKTLEFIDINIRFREFNA